MRKWSGQLQLIYYMDELLIRALFVNIWSAAVVTIDFICLWVVAGNRSRCLTVPYFVTNVSGRFHLGHSLMSKSLSTMEYYWLWTETKILILHIAVYRVGEGNLVFTRSSKRILKTRVAFKRQEEINFSFCCSLSLRDKQPMTGDTQQQSTKKHWISYRQCCRECCDRNWQKTRVLHDTPEEQQDGFF